MSQDMSITSNLEYFHVWKPDVEHVRIKATFVAVKILSNFFIPGVPSEILTPLNDLDKTRKDILCEK